jgi:signal transduction histidine kinase
VRSNTAPAFVRLRISATSPLAEPIANIRIVQELLTNSIKHSGANHISIEVSSGKSLSIIYKDNGKGFIPDSAPKGSGLLNIQARLESLGATAEFTQGKPGVVYTIEIPLIVSREKYP